MCKRHSSHPHLMAYEKFEPTVERDYTLIVSNGLAYRENMPTNEDVDDTEKALAILTEARSTIEDKTKWMPTDWDVADPMDWKHIKAVDKHGNSVLTTSICAVRWTLLGSLDRASHSHYTPDSFRIALNAMQMAIEGWVSLGYNHDDRRRREQMLDIIGIDEYIDDDMEREGHSRCVSTLDDAIKVLQATVSEPTPESPDDDTPKSMRGANVNKVLSATIPEPMQAEAE